MVPPVVTLLTDFGTLDPYVGVMKAALHRIAPEARCIDLTHEIAPQEVGIASFWLAKTQPYFPAGTVHLVVVDPGVGTARRPIAFEWEGHCFVGPDNGIFTDLLASKPEIRVVQAIELDRSRIPAEQKGTTFDGRDLFAPAAALIASGSPLSGLGSEIPGDSIVTSPEILDPTCPKVRAIDRYGNLLTDAPLPDSPSSTVSLLGRKLEFCATYGAAPEGVPFALRSSWDTVEIAVNRGSAAEVLGAAVGTQVSVM